MNRNLTFNNAISSFLAATVKEVAEQHNHNIEKDFSLANSTTAWVLLEAMCQALDMAVYGPYIAAPLMLEAAMDLRALLLEVYGPRLENLPAMPEGWKVLRPFKIDTSDGPFLVFARTPWMACHTLREVQPDLAFDFEAPEDCDLATLPQTEMLFVPARLVLANVSMPGAQFVEAYNEAVARPLMENPVGWRYDPENNCMTMAVVLRIEEEIS